MESATLDSLHIGDHAHNHDVLIQELTGLLNDNQELRLRVNDLYIENLNNCKLSENSVQSCKLLEEYKKQVLGLIKERDSLQTLWQTSQKTIEALETELKAYQSCDGPETQNLSEINKELQMKLDSSIADYVDLEKKYTNLLQKQTTLNETCHSKDFEIKSYKDKYKEIETKLEDLKKEMEKCNIDLGVERKNCEDLKNQITLFQKECVSYIRKEAEAKSKVAEALQLFDVVNTQKTEVCKNIVEMTAEMMELKEKIRIIKSETENHYKNIIDELKDKYNEKVSDMLNHIRNLDAELIEKGLLLNKTLRENKILQITNSEYMQEKRQSLKNVDPKLSLAEKRIQAMFEELVASERRNIQLVCEKQSMVIDMQRLQDLLKRETKKRDWEEKLLKNENEELRLQLEHMQKSLDDTHGMVAKLHNVLSSKSELNYKITANKEDQLHELNKHLANQMELNKKWKDSYVEMCNKLKNRLNEVYEENKSLRIKLAMPVEELSDSSDSSICS